MDSSASTFLAMSANQQRVVHLRLLERAVSVWEEHYPPNSCPTYQETVTGTIQELDVGLPREALTAIHKLCDLANIAGRYREPIVALQDDDLELPDPVEFAYYAVYNAFRLHVLGRDIDPWLVVNQALSAVGLEQASTVLDAAITG